jgi:hypothetical protein
VVDIFDFPSYPPPRPSCSATLSSRRLYTRGLCFLMPQLIVGTAGRQIDSDTTGYAFREHPGPSSLKASCARSRLHDRDRGTRRPQALEIYHDAWSKLGPDPGALPRSDEDQSPLFQVTREARRV